jgi:hypothetical protein
MVCITVALTGFVFDAHVVPLQLKCDSLQSGVMISHFGEAKQWQVVSLDREVPALKIVPEVVYRPKDGQGFFFNCRPSCFPILQCTGSIANGMLPVFKFLRQDGP